jgi:hypothetical protein
MSFEIEVNGGSSVRLPTAGKYCDRDIIVTATGGGGGDTEAAYNEGFADGKQAQYDTFWDMFQQKGNRMDYSSAFGGIGWTNENFKPKYNMKPTSADYMFRKSRISGDLVQMCDGFGVTLDFSNCTNFIEIFSHAPNITRVGVVDISKAGNNISNAFAYCGIKTIDKIILAETNQMLYFPGAATELESVTIEGTIGTTAPYWQYCTKLNKASITSIINALSASTSGLSITLSEAAVNKAFPPIIDGGENHGNVDWLSLIATKENWTISLV